MGGCCSTGDEAGCKLRLPCSDVLFDGVTAGSLARVAGYFEEVEFQVGERVLREGDAVDGSSRLYVLATGAMDVVVEGTTEPVAGIGVGEVFGDVAVLFGTFRSGTVIARTACTAWSVTRDGLGPLLPELPFARNLCFLRGVDVLRGVPDQELKGLTARARYRTLAAGEVVVEAEQQGDSMFVVRSGELDVLRRGSVVASLAKGETFGLWALLSGAPRAATVRARGPASVIEIDREVAGGLHDPIFSYTMSREAVLAVHYGTGLLNDVATDSLTHVLDNLEVRVLSAGQPVSRPGEESVLALVVRKGAIDRPTATHAGFAYLVPASGGAACATQDGTEVVVVHPPPGPEEAASAPAALDSMDGFGWVRNLGKGAFASVCLVQREGTDQLYAMKTPKAVTAASARALAREIGVMSLVDSPFCVRVLGQVRGAERPPRPPSLLLEYVPGGTLLDVVERCQRLSEPDARFYIGCALLALEAVHAKGVIYRDLKPENMLIDAAGYAKVTDFGFAKRTNGDRAFSVCGTELYSAPEIMAHTGSTAAVDFWSMGVVLYELVTGRTPFDAASGTMYHTFRRACTGRFTVPDHVSEECESLLRALLQPDPQIRLGWGGCGEVMGHPWFATLDWDRLRRREIQAPQDLGPPDTFAWRG